MISKIEINDVATLQGKHELDDLKKFNYLFGANGTGKTSISRVINSPKDFPSCSIAWENQNQLETRVYNRNFIDINFNQQKLKGVFTLGQKAQEILDKIIVTKKDITAIQTDIETLNNTLNGADGNGGKKAELLQLTDSYKDKFFKMKRKHTGKLQEGMRGVLNSKDSFMNKVLTESTSNTATLLPLVELEEKATTVFSNVLDSIAPLPEIDNKIVHHETNPILAKRIIGKDDVDIAAMIFKLNNSDWVRQGLSFYNVNDGICPFCQTETSERFRKSLSEYFDETFTQDSNAIKTLIDSYSADANRLQSQIQALIDSHSTFLDIEKLKTEKQLLDSTIVINTQRLTEKQRESSQVITLNPLENILTTISALITSTNVKISENNRIVQNLQNEKKILTSQIWQFVISELAADISEYKKQEMALKNAIQNIRGKIESKTKERRQKEAELQALEKQTTSIVPTRDAINHLLDTFGFNSFKLDLGEEPNTYKLIREDGSDANKTLSEGERNFLTFLYFYHLLEGSQNETDVAKNKVVVIDDPISSLDNDVLFIVSTLIRKLIQDVRDSKSSIKQIFVLTHNIYFHKEVTFNKKRNNGALSEETFWLVKKNGNESFIEKQVDNPIKTSYELLWGDVRKDTRNNATIQNTLRRILENYFKLLGGIPLDELYEKFEGDDQLKCKALCSWVNDGSHSVFSEDFYTPLDTVMVQKFLGVFKQIFQKTGHSAHYDMMMGIDPKENS